jgi:hypothetical protein
MGMFGLNYQDIEKLTRMVAVSVAAKVQSTEPNRVLLDDAEKIASWIQTGHVNDDSA